MEAFEQQADHRDQIRREKYLVGFKNAGSAAFNPLNHKYDQSERGQLLKQAEKDRDVRAAIRERTLELN